MSTCAAPITVTEAPLKAASKPLPADSNALRGIVDATAAQVLVVGSGADAWVPLLRELLPRATLTHVDAGTIGTQRISCDLVVVADLLATQTDPRGFLRSLHQVTPDHARLLLTIPNQANVQSLAAMLAGELPYAGTAPFVYGPGATVGSCFKLLLDCGWLPNLHDEAPERVDARLLDSLIAAAQSAGIPPYPSQRSLLARNPLVDCTKHVGHSQLPGRCKPFTVIVPVNNTAQFAINVGNSPGLSEVGAQVLVSRGAPSAAAAYESARPKALYDWVIYCHQDVYFPAGAGFAISELLQTIEDGKARQVIIGFAGIGLDSKGNLSKCGLVIDRRNRLDFPEGSAQAISIDELAVVMHRDCRFQINPALGWHLWATDLCLQSLRAAADPAPVIVKIPLLHNSYSNYELPPAFHVSAKILREANPDLRLIPTLCGAIS